MYVKNYLMLKKYCTREINNVRTRKNYTRSKNRQMQKILWTQNITGEQNIIWTKTTYAKKLGMRNLRKAHKYVNSRTFQVSAPKNNLKYSKEITIFIRFVLKIYFFHLVKAVNF